MNDAETVKAAIQKLDRRDDRWTYSADNFEVRAGGVMVAENVMPPDGDLIVILHAAVPEIVRVLKLDLARIEAGKPYGLPTLDLARTILAVS